MQKNDDLNETERGVLAALIEESSGYGHDFGITEDVVLPEGVTPKQFSGYMSQLVQKGYVRVENDQGAISFDGRRLPDQFVLTEKALGSVQSSLKIKTSGGK
jgi:hypothetical protein